MTEPSEEKIGEWAQETSDSLPLGHTEWEFEDAFARRVWQEAQKVGAWDWAELRRRCELLEARLVGIEEERDALRRALLAHRADLHEGSNRPCETCRQSAVVLGLKVADRCASYETDCAALRSEAK